jgi:hypothetical protein
MNRHRLWPAGLAVGIVLAFAASPAFASSISMTSAGAVTYTGDAYDLHFAVSNGEQVLRGADPISAGANCASVNLSATYPNQPYGAKCSYDPGGGGAIVPPTSYDLTLGGSGDHVHFDDTFMPSLTVTIHAGGGYDSLYAPPSGSGVVVHEFGEDGDDFLAGGDGNDVLDGGPGYDDFDPGNGSDTVSGGAGDDSVGNGDHADIGNDVYDLGDGAADTVSYTDRSQPITVDLFGTTNNGGELGEGDDISNTERVEGSFSANNTVFGTDGNNTIWGGSGNDNLRGAGGNDTIYAWEGDDDIHGGAGNDTLWPDVGADTVAGDAGNDTIALQDNTADTADCGDDDDTVTNADANDALTNCEHAPNLGGGGGGGGGGGTGTTPTTTTPTTPTTTTTTTTTETPATTTSTPAIVDPLQGLKAGQTVAAATQPSPDGRASGRTANPADCSKLDIDATAIGSLAAKVTVVSHKTMTCQKKGVIGWTLKLNKKGAKAFKKQKKLKVTIKTTLTPKGGKPIVKTLKVTLKKGKAPACYRMASARAHSSC